MDSTPTTSTPGLLPVHEGPELTPRERDVLEYIVAFTTENFFQPSVREICRALGIASTKTVADVIQSLAEKGYIADTDPLAGRAARSLTLVGLVVSVTRTLVPPGVPTDRGGRRHGPDGADRAHG